MITSLQTTTHVYLLGRECLHILADATHLRVRWMKDDIWMLRWDAQHSEEGEYVSQRLDGKLVERLSAQSLAHSLSSLLLQSMQLAAASLPLYPNPDIVRELEWFVLD